MNTESLFRQILVLMPELKMPETGNNFPFVFKLVLPVLSHSSRHSDYVLAMKEDLSRFRIAQTTGWKRDY